MLVYQTSTPEDIVFVIVNQNKYRSHLIHLPTEGSFSETTGWEFGTKPKAKLAAYRGLPVEFSELGPYMPSLVALFPTKEFAETVASKFPGSIIKPAGKLHLKKGVQLEAIKFAQDLDP